MTEKKIQEIPNPLRTLEGNSVFTEDFNRSANVQIRMTENQKLRLNQIQNVLSLSKAEIIRRAFLGLDNSIIEKQLAQQEIENDRN